MSSEEADALEVVIRRGAHNVRERDQSRHEAIAHAIIRSVWLAELRAEAWEDGLDAGRQRWADVREFGEEPVNPYRGGAA